MTKLFVSIATTVVLTGFLLPSLVTASTNCAELFGGDKHTASTAAPPAAAPRFASLSPQGMLVRKFESHPQIKAISDDLIARGYSAMPTEFATIDGRDYGPNPAGYAGRSISTYLVSRFFLDGKGRFETVAALITEDNYAGIPGYQDQSEFLVLSPAKLKAALDLLRQP